MLGSSKWKEWFDGKAIFHNFVANVLLAAGTSLIFMLWSFMQGQSGPWIAITGIAASASALWLRNQWLLLKSRSEQPKPAGDTQFIQQISSLESSLQAAIRRAENAESALANLKNNNSEMESRNAKKRTKLADTKDVIRAQLQAAPQAFVLSEVQAWTTATNQLLCDLRVEQLRFGHYNGRKDDEIKARYQQNLAHLRGLLATLTEDKISIH